MPSLSASEWIHQPEDLCHRLVFYRPLITQQYVSHLLQSGFSLSSLKLLSNLLTLLTFLFCFAPTVLGIPDCPKFLGSSGLYLIVLGSLQGQALKSILTAEVTSELSMIFGFVWFTWVLRGHLWCSEVHMECKALNLNWPYARQGF